MSNATKGSWQRSGVRVKLGKEDCIAVGPDGSAIAFIPIGRKPEEHSGAIADAQLIAAAPDLLEALRDMLSGWRYIREVYGDLYGVEWDRAQQKAESSIQKATTGE